MDVTHVYEVEFDVCARSQRAYQEWLALGFVEWINHDAISEFAIYRNDKGLSPEVKYHFGFDSVEGWIAFVNSDAHDAAVTKLAGMTEGLNATFWDRDSVSLEGVPGVFRDGVPSITTGREKPN